MQRERTTRSIEVVDSIDAPRRPDPGKLRDYYFVAAQRLTGGIIRYRDSAFWLGPLELVAFHPPAATATGWRWDLRGGLLVGGTAGSLQIAWEEGRLRMEVRGYTPALPAPIYRLTQSLFHHLLTRLVLLQLRGRLPAVALPASPAGRLGAGVADLLLCLAVARGRPFRAITIGVVYHLACWRLGGRTLGGAVFRQRLQAVDGSPLTAGQALVRLALLPVALLRLRAVHDEVAGTDVVRRWPAGR